MNNTGPIEKVAAEWRAQGGTAAALLDQKRWVCWKKEPRKDGTFSKPPINPETGHRFDIRTPEGRNKNLVPFSAALAHMKAGRCDGIGVITGEIGGIPLCGVDIDHCIVDGKVIPERLEDVQRLAGCGYVELSPSSTGVHSFAVCKRPQGFAFRRGGVEVYDNGQYITLTGVRFRGAEKPLNRDDDAVYYLCDKYLRKDQTAPQERSAPAGVPHSAVEPIGQDWRDRIEEALRHDPVLASLWASDRPNGNESGDDQALMNKLAYWLSKDRPAMIEAFLASPHSAAKDVAHAEKLQRPDYLPRTADRAIRDCSDTAAESNRRYLSERFQTDQHNDEPASRDADPGIGDRMRKSKKKPALLSFSEVAYEAPVWLVEPYIPSGKITIIQGDSGTGKTAFACALAACISADRALLGHRVAAPGAVLMISVEDDPSTLRGRIEASGGDVTKCFFPDGAAGLSFDDPCIEEMIKACQARIVVFDPLQAFLGSKIDMFRANETRPVLAGLAEVAKRNNCAVVIISHLNKSDTKAIYKALGSVDIVAASRSVLYVGRNPENDAQCAVVHLKSSNARNGSSFLYTIGERGGVHFDGYCNLTAEDLSTAAKRKDTGADYDREPLVQVFRQLMTEKPGGGFWPYEELKTCGAKLLGFPPFGNAYDLKNKLDCGLARELQRIDGIIVSYGAKQNGVRGVRIEHFAVQAAFQTGMPTERE